MVRYKIIVNRATELPTEIHMFTKRPDEAEWECRLTTLFEYATEDEIKSVLNRDFLPQTNVLQ